MALLLFLQQQAVGLEHRLQLLQRHAEVIVDDDVVILVVVHHLADGFLHAPGDDLLAVLAAAIKTLAQGLLARWQDEHRQRLGHQPAHLLGTLPVDFQDQVVALVQGFLQRTARSAVEVAEYFGVLQEVALGDQRLEFFMDDEVIVHAVLFARAHGAGGVRDRNANVLVVLDQRRDQAGLAGAGGGGNDVEGAAAVIHGGGGLTRCSVLVHASVRSVPSG